MISPVPTPTPNSLVRSGSFANRPVRLGLTALVAVVLGTPLIGVTPAAGAPTAAHKSRVTFGVEPATGHHPDARPHFDFGVTPGATLSDHVAVLNYSAKPLTLQLYPTDAVNTSTGGFGLLPGGTTPTGAGAWVTLPKHSRTVRVPAQSAKAPGEVIVPFTLNVPDNATPGDHVGGIVASLRTEGHNGSGQNIVLVQRVGTRLFIRVAGTLSPNLSLSGLHATYHGTLNPFGKGHVTVHYTVHNTGNVELGLGQHVKVSGLFGSSSQVSVPSVPLLLPGASLSEVAQVPGVWPQFTAKATVTATPVAVPGDSDPRLVAVSASTHLLAIPWPLIVLILLLIVVAGLVVVARRRAHRAPASPPVAERVSA
jgi:hypothetical protein